MTNDGRAAAEKYIKRTVSPQGGRGWGADTVRRVRKAHLAGQRHARKEILPVLVRLDGVLSEAEESAPFAGSPSQTLQELATLIEQIRREG
jgi:hypothetical protein